MVFPMRYSLVDINFNYVVNCSIKRCNVIEADNINILIQIVMIAPNIVYFCLKDLKIDPRMLSST